jgi:DNA-binding NtrC family response regulator
MGNVMSPLEGNSVPESSIPWFIYGNAPTMRSLNAMVAEIAPTRIPVLIMGECGTGKDTYARLIHRLSQNSEAPYHRVDCAALQSVDFFRKPNGQLGKSQNEKNWGTIYLDGVQDLDLHCQRVLLSHLCDDEDNAKHRALCRRLISSTNTSLELEVERGRFRRELYFRINGASIHLPPLKERKEDIPALLEHFLRKHGNAKSKAVPPLGGPARDLLLAYSWPGNIRELENLALKILTLGETRALDELELLRSATHMPEPAVGVPSLKTAVRAASQKTERELIILALERTRWNRKRAAQQLGISYKSFLNKLKAIEASPGGQ